MATPALSPQAKRTLSIGGATYDLFLRTKNSLVGDCSGTPSIVLPLGEKIRVEQATETCGGGAANTAVGLRRLACNAHFCGVVGSDQWGQHMLDNLRNEGVNDDAITVVEHETSSFSLILSAGSGERVILYEPGTNQHLHDTTFDRAHAATMDWIVLNHIHERTGMIEDDLIALLREHKNIGLTWNPGGHHIHAGMNDKSLRQLLLETDLLICNKEEACTFTGTTDIAGALEALCSAGVETVCITDGKNGAYAMKGKNRWHCPILLRTDVVDTTGAGDGFCTGMTWALLQGLDLPEALRTGTIEAASVVSAIGAQTGLLTDTQIRTRLQTERLDVEEF